LTAYVEALSIGDAHRCVDLGISQKTVVARFERRNCRATINDDSIAKERWDPDSTERLAAYRRPDAMTERPLLGDFARQAFQPHRFSDRLDVLSCEVHGLGLMEKRRLTDIESFHQPSRVRKSELC
jgi:hypothetical protein